MDNLEEVLQYLNEFDQTSDKSISPELEKLLEHIAKTGRTVFPWHLLKPLISFKLEKVLNDFFETSPGAHPYLSEPTTKGQDFHSMVGKLVDNLNCFSGTPFTIQRICELITQPRKHYKTSDKFLRGVEKNIMVVSTVQPDGTLITRSTNTVLTNGNVSPMDSVPVNTTPNPASTTPNPASTTPNAPSTTPNPASTTVHSSPLNTNFQENGPCPLSPSAVLPAGEKTQTLLAKNSMVNSSDQVNGSQEDETIKQQPVATEDLKCQGDSQTVNNVASDNDEAVPVLNPPSDNSTDNVQTCNEEEQQALERSNKVEIDEKLAGEAPEGQKDEKMDES